MRTLTLYAAQLWDETDITDVRVDSASRSISFYTLHLGALACIQDSCAPSLRAPLAASARFHPRRCMHAAA